MKPSALTTVAGVAGLPISHSLSPTLHNAWIEALNLDAVYVSFEPQDFVYFATAQRGGGIRGLNVTSPFKRTALEIADVASPRAAAAGAANLLIFEMSGEIHADNTDGEGLLTALGEQARGFDPVAGPAVVLGAGGAARAVRWRLLSGRARRWVRIINRIPGWRSGAGRTDSRGPRRLWKSADAIAGALGDANVLINATSADPNVPFEHAASSTVVMDMVYRPLVTPFLAKARSRGLRIVDGLAMLIGQARPSFEAFFGAPPPDIEIRARAIEALGGGT